MKTVVNGIFLKRISFSETSLIVTVFTRQHGTKTYLFPAGKKKNSNVLQPLALVELETFNRPDSDLGKIARISPEYVYQTIPFHPIKSGIAFFIAELLASCLKSEDQDTQGFDFLSQEMIYFDQLDQLGNYPAWFLLEFTLYIGCTPHVVDDSPNYLDLIDGTLTCAKPPNHPYIKTTSVNWMHELLKLPKEQGLSLPIPKAERKLLLGDLLIYYTHHVDGFKTPKSLEVLETIWA